MTDLASGDLADERIDWRGQAIDCARCAHADLVARGGCRPGHACVEDRYARRIDRFFDWNPRLGDAHVRHGHFEVRAIAAKHADVFRLPALLNDPEEAVRWNAVNRLPMRYKLMLRADPHREVRIRIAAQLDDADLVPMMQDSDYYVRLVIARRVSPDLLGLLLQDPEAQVRSVVAARIATSSLWPLVYDPDPEVRLAAVERLPVDAVDASHEDPDWRVRHIVAQRSPNLAILGRLADDDDALVREQAQGRLVAHGMRPRELAS